MTCTRTSHWNTTRDLGKRESVCILFPNLQDMLPETLYYHDGAQGIAVRGSARSVLCCGLVAVLPPPHHVNVNVNVNNLLAISKSDFDNSGEPGPQAKGVNHLETPLRQLQVTHRASSCAKRGGHVQLCSKARGVCGIEPKTFQRRGQLLSRPPTTGPQLLHIGLLFPTISAPHLFKLGCTLV